MMEFGLFCNQLRPVFSHKPRRSHMIPSIQPHYFSGVFLSFRRRDKLVEEYQLCKSKVDGLALRMTYGEKLQGHCFHICCQFSNQLKQVCKALHNVFCAGPVAVPRIAVDDSLKFETRPLADTTVAALKNAISGIHGALGVQLRAQSDILGCEYREEKTLATLLVTLSTFRPVILSSRFFNVSVSVFHALSDPPGEISQINWKDVFSQDGCRGIASWLEYSVQADGGFCFPCMMFSVGRKGVDLGVLVSRLLNTSRGTLEELKIHETKCTHCEAVTKADPFMKASKFNYLIGDEVTNYANKEQLNLVLVLRYLNLETSEIAEYPVELVECDMDITGKAVADYNFLLLQKFNLDPTLLLGQGYDGAGDMAGKTRKLQLSAQKCIRSHFMCTVLRIS
ncbi:hypothetical protein GQR58_027850 [Nymphon striatum]|nr:hypothetical protein GQR58_027850 [Nymphon striatum]